MLHNVVGGDHPRRAWAAALVAIVVFIIVFTSTRNTIVLSRLGLGSLTRIPGHIGQHAVPHLRSSKTRAQATSFVKPSNVTIVGLVFFGRKSRVEILRCYLERNMVHNGGWLDEIQWYQNTEKESDLNYLDEIIASHPTTNSKIKNEGGMSGGAHPYENIWGRLDPGKLYVKIDDDILWFDDSTIPSMVTLKLAHPEYFLVSANTINNPLMGWVHYRLGATHPYLPHFGNLTFPNISPWRYTDYPIWQGPADYNVSAEAEPPTESDPRHWLRLKDTEPSAMQRTPISSTEYSAYGKGQSSWSVAAQHHYSLLENLADDQLHLYNFGGQWIVNYDRISINFITLWADEVLENLPMDDVDEPWLTMHLPRRLGKDVVVDSGALAAHFSFGPQNKGLGSTDLLARYKDYADEMICRG